jgi:hypothetical protein
MLSNFSSVNTQCLCFCFLSIKNPVVLSLLTKLWIVCWQFFHHETYVEIFAYTFQQIHSSHSCHTEIHVALKYTEPWHTTLLTNCNWEQMANGADNCCLLLTNHKQSPMHEPHCSLWNIMPWSGLQVNYFPSFLILPAKSTKFVYVSWQTAHQPLWSAEPWTCQDS